MEPHDTPTSARRGVDAAFGVRPPRVPWWGNSRVRLGVLLAVLGAAVLGLAGVRDDLVDFGSGPAQASGVAFAPGYPGRGAPEVARLPVRDFAALHNAGFPVTPPRVGRLYQAGTITTSNLWSDNQPVPSSSSSSPASSLPGGYEMRWWALD